MKKLIALALICIIAAGMTGCGSFNILESALQSYASDDADSSDDSSESSRFRLSLPSSSKTESESESESESSRFELSFPSESEEETEAEARSKEISSNGLTIWMPTDYRVANQLIPDGSDICVLITNIKQDIGLAALKEPRSDFEYTVVESVDDYLELHQANCKGESVSRIKTEKGIKYFEYSYKSDSLKAIRYFSLAKQSADDYWLLQFFCYENDYDSMKDNFIQWAQTATVS